MLKHKQKLSDALIDELRKRGQNQTWFAKEAKDSLPNVSRWISNNRFPRRAAHAVGLLLLPAEINTQLAKSAEKEGLTEEAIARRYLAALQERFLFDVSGDRLRSQSADSTTSDNWSDPNSRYHYKGSDPSGYTASAFFRDWLLRCDNDCMLVHFCAAEPPEWDAQFERSRSGQVYRDAADRGLRFTFVVPSESVVHRWTGETAPPSLAIRRLQMMAESFDSSLRQETERVTLYVRDDDSPYFADSVSYFLFLRAGQAEGAVSWTWSDEAKIHPVDAELRRLNSRGVDGITRHFAAIEGSPASWPEPLKGTRGAKGR
jgi:hypothetical protein